MAPTPASRLTEARLYFVCDARAAEGGLEPLLEAAIAGGVAVIQLRDKSADMPTLLSAGHVFRQVASRHGVTFIVNDDPELAVDLGADGVHVGQDDGDVATVRSVVGANAIVGLSTHNDDQLKAAHEGDARPDYISVGPVWETPTKPGRPAAGLDYLRNAATASEIPFFAIGSIDRDSVGQVLEAGAERVVVVRAIRDADDPQAAAAELMQRIRQHSE